LFFSRGGVVLEKEWDGDGENDEGIIIIIIIIIIESDDDVCSQQETRVSSARQSGASATSGGVPSRYRCRVESAQVWRDVRWFFGENIRRLRLAHRQREKREPNVWGGVGDGRDHKVGTESDGLLDKRDDDGGGEENRIQGGVGKVARETHEDGDGFVDGQGGVRKIYDGVYLGVG
jgi:hypothetical protein